MTLIIPPQSQSTADKLDYELREIQFAGAGRLRVEVTGEPNQIRKALVKFDWKDTLLQIGAQRVWLPWDKWPPRPGPQQLWLVDLKQLEQRSPIRDDLERFYHKARLLSESQGRLDDASNLYQVEMLLRTSILMRRAFATEATEDHDPNKAGNRWQRFGRWLEKFVRVVLELSLGSIKRGPLRYLFMRELGAQSVGVLSLLVVPSLSLLILASIFSAAPRLELAGELRLGMHTDLAQIMLGEEQSVSLFSYFTYWGVAFVSFAYLFMLLSAIALGRQSHLRWIFHVYYGLVSGWGEQIRRPLLLLVLLGAAIPFLRGDLLLAWELESWSETLSLTGTGVLEFLGAVLTRLPSRDDPNYLLLLTMKPLSVLFITLLVVSVRRQFRR